MIIRIFLYQRLQQKIINFFINTRYIFAFIHPFKHSKNENKPTQKTITVLVTNTHTHTYPIYT